jgi:hypothetical protein
MVLQNGDSLFHFAGGSYIMGLVKKINLFAGAWDAMANQSGMGKGFA